MLLWDMVNIMCVKHNHHPPLARTRKAHGSGFGLSIRVASHLGRGTTFTVCLPLQRVSS